MITHSMFMIFTLAVAVAGLAVDDAAPATAALQAEGADCPWLEEMRLHLQRPIRRLSSDADMQMLAQLNASDAPVAEETIYQTAQQHKNNGTRISARQLYSMSQEYQRLGMFLREWLVDYSNRTRRADHHMDLCPRYIQELFTQYKSFEPVLEAHTYVAPVAPAEVTCHTVEECRSWIARCRREIRVMKGELTDPEAARLKELAEEAPSTRQANSTSAPTVAALALEYEMLMHEQLLLQKALKMKAHKK